MSVFTSANTLRSTSLNGWWDFCPSSAGESMLVIPSEGWEEDVYLAPSSWTGAGAAVFGYPEAWGPARQGWLRRFIRVGKYGNRRTVLQFDAVGPRATVFLNGTAVGETLDGFNPFEVDITEVATPGVNELVIRILDTPKDEHGQARHPAGSGGFAGIWQDVRMVERADVHMARCAVRTSIRTGRVTAEVEIFNASRRARTVTVRNDVVAWKKTLRIATAGSVLDLGERTLELEPKSSVTYTLEAPWEQPKLWAPAHPFLYLLRLRIEEGGHALFVQGQRFGFREIWSEGHDLLLNGEPLRIFSDHGPLPELHHGTEAWIRRWFDLLRATGLNHTRIVGACASQRLRDLADEEGILLTLETALNGESERLSTESADFWVHAADHVRRLVLQDRNHPSVVLWSVAHRLLRDLTTPSPAFRELPRLKGIIRELDPTRLAYFDGDSMHWSAESQEILDGPPGRFESIYDATERLRLATAYAAVEDAERYILLARANGAAGIAVDSPLSMLPRIPARAVQVEHDSLEAPGLKLPSIPAGSAELNFWSDSKKYRLPKSEALQAYAEAFRKIAVIDTTPATAGFTGQPVVRRVVVCNDSEAPVSGTLEASLRLRDSVFRSESFPVTVARGKRFLQEVRFEIPDETPAGTARIDYLLRNPKGQKLDLRRIPFRLCRPIERHRRLAGKSIAVYGPGGLQEWLQSVRIPAQRIVKLTDEALRGIRALIVEPHGIESGSDQLPALRNFVLRGGGLLVLEQKHSPFHGIPRVPYTAWLASPRNPEHEVFAGLKNPDLVCWDNLPVATSAYANCEPETVLAATNGQASLLELRSGKGIVVGTQLRFDPVLGNTPAAAHLLMNLLTYVATFRASGRMPEHPALQGDFTPVSLHAGKGYAEEFWLRNRVTSAATEAALAAATLRANADFPPVQIFSIGDHWELVHRTDGWASAIGCSRTHPVYLFSRFHADVESSDLKIEGEGSVSVTVGGVTREVTLAEGEGLIEGIRLEKGYNAVLLRWKPDRPDSRIRAVWCDSRGKPQTTFAFQ